MQMKFFICLHYFCDFWEIYAFVDLLIFKIKNPILSVCGLNFQRSDFEEYCFLDMTRSSLIIVYHRFGGMCRFFLQGRRLRQHVLPKCQETFTRLHGVTSKKKTFYSLNCRHQQLGADTYKKQKRCWNKSENYFTVNAKCFLIRLT